MNCVNGRVIPFFKVEPRRYPLLCPQRRQVSLLSSASFTPVPGAFTVVVVGP
jgi:hypothetical protein